MATKMCPVCGVELYHGLTTFGQPMEAKSVRKEFQNDTVRELPLHDTQRCLERVVGQRDRLIECAETYMTNTQNGIWAEHLATACKDFKPPFVDRYYITEPVKK